VNNVAAEIVIILIALWTIPWKIYAVWLSVKNKRFRWFVVLIVINTVSILELFYIFHIEKKGWAEIKHDFKKGYRLIRGK